MDDSSQVSGLQESLSDSRDRLSELPDSLILEILSFLPMTDVVKTTLLSKRWKDLWTITPYIDFQNFSYPYFCKFGNLVCGFLARWKGLKIVKTGISFWLDHYNSSNVVDLWLIFSIKKQVEDLRIDFVSYRSPYPLSEVDYYPPQFLYSCSSIRNLSLVSCKLEIDKNVQWNRLKSLTIEGAEPVSEASLNHILAGSPQLEVLNLSILESSGDSINIQSTSLKMLKIHTDLDFWSLHTGPQLQNTMLRIWAPNLQTLEFSPAAYRMPCVSLDVPSLTTAILRFRVYTGRHEMLRQVFRSILHVQKLTVSEYCNGPYSTDEEAEPLSEIALNHILCGAPNLEVLNLSILRCGEYLNIESTSLKMIKIHRLQHRNTKKLRNGEDNTMLSIWAPNLETLEISGSSFGNCSLNVPSLTNATVDLHHATEVALQEMLGGIFQSILHVEKVTLSYICTQALLKMKKKYRETPSDAKFLKLYASAPNKILGVVKMFPHLTMLVIECDTVVMTSRASKESDALDSKESCCLLQYLKTVEITWPLDDDPSIYLVVEILLKNAHMLEKMVFRSTSVSTPESMFSAEEKVRNMPRSSSTLEFIFMNKY